jgi:hypothetical protein
MRSSIDTSNLLLPEQQLFGVYIFENKDPEVPLGKKYVVCCEEFDEKGKKIAFDTSLFFSSERNEAETWLTNYLVRMKSLGYICTDLGKRGFMAIISQYISNLYCITFASYPESQQMVTNYLCFRYNFRRVLR